jgi:predicted enzyme related to lactoylglutathione lyase
MHRVIGLGGPFLKSKDPKGLAAWYEKHLGIPFSGGTYAVWHINEKTKGFNILSFFPSDSGYFKPSEKECMVNFVVEDLFELIETLRKEGVTIAGDPVEEEYGKFGWILDPEGNKIELWEAPAKSEES